MIQSLMKSEIITENDIIWARKKAREIARLLKMDLQEQTRVATAVSEIARNAYQYARGGKIEFRIIKEDLIKLSIIIKDNGTGIKNLKEILNGTYSSPQGMGVGIVGAQRLMDAVLINSTDSGTTIELKKVIPGQKTLLTPYEIKNLVTELMSQVDDNPMVELQKQNHEILVAIKTLNEKKEELFLLNQELADTNRGVVALYSELDEKAESLRIANETKTRFLSDMTHEFRSPVNSILSISNILLQDAKAEDAPEREKQVNFIIKAATGLSDLVNDLLDIAKIEAGKISVRPVAFSLSEFFSTLRGLMRPLNYHVDVQINFLNIEEDLELFTDEAKVAQILKNLISNAMKYTEHGEITISSHRVDDKNVCLTVKDTGIGIPADSLMAIFEEFVQIENHLQRKTKGTGLGLPLTKKLTHLLGGTLNVESALGEGSTFTVILPIQYMGAHVGNYESYKEVESHYPKRSDHAKKILIIDDEDAQRYFLKNALKDMPFDLLEAKDGFMGFEMARTLQPDLIILDLNMPILDGFDFLKKSMDYSSFRKIPIIIYTSRDLENEERDYLEQVTSAILPKDQVDHTSFQILVKKILG